MLISALTSSWPIFMGLALMMMANGLLGTLLGVRASIEEFNTATIGIVMSLYYVGFLAGSYYVPKLISKVGHIRVFTALASLASDNGFAARPLYGSLALGFGPFIHGAWLCRCLYRGRKLAE